MALKPDNPIDQAATAWVIAKDRGLSAEETETLDRWLAQDVRHRGAFVRAQAVWGEAIDQGGDATDAIPAHLPLFTRRRMLAGGGLAVAAGGAAIILTRAPSYATELGESRRLALADGSSALLNTSSRMVVSFSDDRRTIELPYGEAWFQVAKDRARPFVIHAGEVKVQAVGTAFSVKKDRAATEVLVTEGIVQLEVGGQAAGRMAEGQRALVSDSGDVRLSSLAPASMARRLAWRDGLVMLDGETLAEAAAEINRYNRRQIVIAPGLGTMRMVGVFRTGDLEGFAMAVKRIAAVPMQADDERILLGFES